MSFIPSNNSGVHFMSLLRGAFLLLSAGFVMQVDANPSPAATERAKKFVAAHDAKIRPLDLSASIAWWNANITGKDEDFKKKEDAQNKIDEALSNKATFAELKTIKQLRDKGEIEDKILARAIDVLYLMYLEKQVDP